MPNDLISWTLTLVIVVTTHFCGLLSYITKIYFVEFVGVSNWVLLWAVETFLTVSLTTWLISFSLFEVHLWEGPRLLTVLRRGALKAAFISWDYQG